MSAWTLHSRASMMQTVLAYNLGRITTYIMIGGFMGFVGSFVDAAGRIVGLQGFANILGGLFILVWVFTKYSLPLTKWTPIQLPFIQKTLKENKEKTGLAAIFTSGILLGFLPCGLTYAMHMKAAATGNVWSGALTLAFFGVGTLPALLLVGLFSVGLKKALRSKILYIANALAVFIGVISILRGMVYNGWIASINPWLW